MNQRNHFLKKKIKKIIGLIKDKLGGKIIIKFVGLRAKTYSYLTDDSSEDKKAKGTKKCVIKKFKFKFKFKFQDCRNCLDAIQLNNKNNYIEKNKIDIGRIKENCKKFIKNNKSILKLQ